MRKFDACVGREARINKLLLKKPPGLVSASGASLDEPLRAIKGKNGKERNVRQKNSKKNGQRKETNTESSASHKIFGDGLRSMGSA